MASSWPLQGTLPPSWLQLALALSVVKTKPSSLDIGDYIQSIRHHIKDGRNEEAISNPQKHVDSITFWRQAYERSEAAQAKLLDKIYDLEQKNESLQMKENRGVQPGMSGVAKGKRKMTMMESPLSKPSSAKSKRTKTMCSEPTLFASGFIPSLLATASFNAAPFDRTPMSPLLRHIYELQRLMQQRKLDGSRVALACTHVCQAAEKLLLSNMDDCVGSANQGASLKDVLTGLTNGYSFVQACLTKLSSIKGNESNAGLVKYHIVHQFRHVLSQMHQYVVHHARLSISKETGSVRKGKQGRSRATNTRASAMTSPPQEVQEVTGKFVQYLACMILGTERLSNKANPFEGLLYHILEHAGKIMAQFAFRDLQQNPVMRIEGDKLPSPVAFVATSDEPMVSQRAAEWESQHIIWLLDQALALAARSTTKGRDGVAPLLAREKLRLQNTLLHGIFGTEVQISQDCLALPAVPSPPKAYANERLDTSHWFTQELWKSVGWDVLLKKA